MNNGNNNGNGRGGSPLVRDPANPNAMVKMSTLRNRRKRARRAQRLAMATGRAANPRPLRRPLSAITEAKEEKEDVEEILGRVSPCLRSFADAVVDPFGDSALGALLPDDWNTTSLAAVDRLTIDVDPSLFFNANTPLATMEGVAVVLAPRCVAAGYLRLIPGGGGGDMVTPCFPATADFSVWNETDSYGNATHPLDYQYCLIVIFLGTTAGNPNVQQYGFNPVASAMEDSNIARFGTAINGGACTVIPFTRFPKYADNVDSGRMLGAGLKIWSEAAPINTGGTAYGGWVTQHDLLRCLSTDTAKAAGSLQDILVHRHHYRGVEGVTVRYDCTQNDKQTEYVATRMQSLTYNAANWLLEFDDGMEGLSAQDQVSPGDYCPMVVWKFDSNAQEDVYSLRVEARVHLQGRPVGTSPFLGIAPIKDPLLDEVITIINNPELFPPVAEGHSFKGFMASVKRFASGAARGVRAAVPHIMRFLDMANRYAPKAAELVNTYAPLIEAAAL